MLRLQTLASALLALGLLLGPLAPASAQGNQAPGAGGPGGGMRFNLQLTAEQQAKSQAIFASARMQVMQVLTADQRKQFEPSEHQEVQRGLLRMVRGAERGDMHLGVAAEVMAQTLTTAQQAKVKAIAADADAQMQALSTDQRRSQGRDIMTTAGTRIWDVLTFDQRTAVRKAIAGARHTIVGLRGAMRDLTLTDAQTTQLNAIQQQAQQQFRAILTPDQQQQLDQMRNGRQGRGN